MKITITNCFTWYNKGDAGIVLGTIESLKKVFDEDIEINILSYTPEEDRERYMEDITVKGVYSNILNPYNQTTNEYKMGKLELFLETLGNLININFNKKSYLQKQEGLKAIENSDLIVIIGGGFLGGENLGSNLVHMNQLYINSKFKAPCILLGTSIEPTKNLKVNLCMKYILRKLTHIFPRETITYEYLRSFLPEEKITLIPDMAFALNEKINMNFDFIDEIENKFDKLIGITVRSWDFPNCANKVDLKNKYIDSIVDTIIHCSDEYNSKFVFVPQVIFNSGKGDDDSVIAETIKDKLPTNYKDRFLIRKDDWSPREIKSLVSKFDLFIGTRMHSNIFATSEYIPTVAIAYEKKTNGIMETLDLNEYVIDINQISSEVLIKKVRDCIVNKEEIYNHLVKKISHIQNEIYEKSYKIKGV